MDHTPHLAMQTLLINEGSSHLGLHHDPECPLPAFICGLGLHRWVEPPTTTSAASTTFAAAEDEPDDVESESESEAELEVEGQFVRIGRGGRLILADGLFDLEYGPTDAVLMDGNYLHGVTALRDLPGTSAEGLRDGSAARPELQRFSIIRLSTFGKEKGMHKDGSYEGQWRESWRGHIV